MCTRVGGGAGLATRYAYGGGRSAASRFAPPEL